jgi:hypothetical protein
MVLRLSSDRSTSLNFSPAILHRLLLDPYHVAHRGVYLHRACLFLAFRVYVPCIQRGVSRGGPRACPASTSNRSTHQALSFFDMKLVLARSLHPAAHTSSSPLRIGTEHFSIYHDLYSSIIPSHCLTFTILTVTLSSTMPCRQCGDCSTPPRHPSIMTYTHG